MARLADYTGDPRLDAVMRHYAGADFYGSKPPTRDVEAEWAAWPEEDEWYRVNGRRVTERYGKRHLRIRATEVLMAIDAEVPDYAAARPKP